MTVIFGGSWGAPVCEGATEVETPIGAVCDYCNEPIVDGDQGTLQPFVATNDMPWMQMRPVHKECSLRQVLGGAGHFQDHARWCRTVGDPDGGMTRRESALWVWAWVQENGMTPE
jgi:hypothetical protein